MLSSVPGGPTYAIARNQLNIGTPQAPEYSEFTGPTFSADGKVLFVNIQTPGHHPGDHRSLEQVPGLGHTPSKPRPARDTAA